MKFNKKIALISAALLTLSPAIATVSSNNAVQVEAATKQKNTITVSGDTGLYSSTGKMLFTYRGKPFTTFNKETTLKYYGNPIKIKKGYYYYIGHGAYADASYVEKINGREALSLNLNSYVYTKNGKRTKKLLRKGLSYNFIGKYKKNDNATNNVFYREGHYYQLKTVRINGNDYYQIAKNKYIRVANIAAIGAHPVLSNEMTVTVKRNTPLLTVDAQNGAANTGKTLKKGQKFTVDAQVGLYDGGNSTPNAYRIKGTNNFIWVSDAYTRHNVYLNVSNYTELRTYTVRPPKDGLQFYDANGENITPKNYIYPKHQLLGVDGKMYIWIPSENKAVLCYHIVATQKNFNTQKINGHYRNDSLDLGNAFVKATDVEYYGGLNKPELINTETEAKTDAQKQATNSEITKLRNFVNDAENVTAKTAYKLSSASTRKNYDTTIKEAENLLRSKRNLPSAEVKLYNWILQTRVNNLYGKKIQVKNIHKLTKSEINLLQTLLNSIGDSDFENQIFTQFRYDRVDNKVYRIKIEKGKIISKIKQPLTNFVTKK